MISGRKMLFLRGLFFVGFAIHLAIAQDDAAAEATTAAAEATTAAGEATTEAAGTTASEPEGAQGADNATKSNDVHKEEEAGKNVDYCDPSLCTIGYMHVGCKASNQLHERCSLDAELITISERLQNHITHIFNELRDKVARGGYNGLSAAARMGTLKWDSELAHLAEYNVQKCYLQTDYCVNTKTNSHVGQIIGYRGLKGNIPILEDILKDIIGTWLKTSSSTSMLDILHYNNQITRLPKYNFLQIVLEDVKYVGCGIVQQVRNQWFQTYFTCNFNVAPTVGAAIYETNFMSGTSCKTGRNKEYANLCSAAETYSKPAIARSRFTYLSSQQNLSLGATDTSGDVVTKLGEEDTAMPKMQLTSDPTNKASDAVVTAVEKKSSEEIQRQTVSNEKKASTIIGLPVKKVTTARPSRQSILAAYSKFQRLLKKKAMALKQRSVIQRRDGGEETTTAAGDAAATGATTEATEAAATGTTAGDTETKVAAGDEAETTTPFDLVETTTPESVKIKDILLKKFNRFLKLTERALQARKQRKIVVITSNHEVVDMKNNQAKTNANDTMFEPNEAKGNEELSRRRAWALHRSSKMKRY